MKHYNSIISFEGFETDLSIDQLEGLWETYIAKYEKEFESYGNLRGWGEPRYLRQYKFTLSDGYAYFSMQKDDYYARHYCDHELAVFVALAIKEGSRAVIRFKGDDGEEWGFAVESGKVYPLESSDLTIQGTSLTASDWETGIDNFNIGYLLRVYGGVEPNIVMGPFPKSTAICDADILSRVAEHLNQDPYNPEDSLFLIDLSIDGTLQVHSFSNEEMNAILSKIHIPLEHQEENQRVGIR